MFLIRVAALGFIASVIMSFRRSYERERFMARRDRMTGALIQETFREQAPITLAAARTAGCTVLVVLVDFDNFKAVNTEHGHAAGDEALKRFAMGVRSILRREDDFGRLGGDEFAVIATVHSPEDAESFARALHERLSNVLRDGPFAVTCSMGALIVPPTSSGSASELLHRADMLMYGAKHSGKDGLHFGWCDSSAALAPTDVVLTESLRPA
jgi:diguanylate cyclase (GGDEF)-like protein